MRTGDRVHHIPSDEEWIVAYVDGDEIAWIGWPQGWAKTSDCTLLRSCTDQEHEKWLRDLAASHYTDDKRVIHARAAVAALQPSNLIGAKTMTEKLGRFGHHPDPAIDFCVEVDHLTGEVFNAEHGMADRAPVVAGIRKAMEFRVGGDPGAVAAKDMLRDLENRFCPI